MEVEHVDEHFRPEFETLTYSRTGQMVRTAYCLPSGLACIDHVNSTPDRSFLPSFASVHAFPQFISIIRLVLDSKQDTGCMRIHFSPCFVFIRLGGMCVS